MRSRDKKDSTIHGIVEIPLEKVDIEEEYDVLRTLGEGYFATVILARHRRTSTTVVLKQVHTELTSSKDFFREYHYSYHLSPHPNILSSYTVAFTANNCYTFAQEYAQFGDLAGNVKAGGLPVESCKKIAQQLSSALEFLHSKQLVHRDIKLENVLVFEQSMEKVKLCDFGATRRDGSLVSKVCCTWTSFQPPEVCDIVKNEKYHCQLANDSWQFGVVLYVCLTGTTPWQKADAISDPHYSTFAKWQKRRVTKIPNNFKKFSTRLLRLFRRLFENKPEKRAPVTEVTKYLKDSWLSTKLKTSQSTPAITSSSMTPADTKDSQNTYIGNHENECGINDESKTRLRKLLNSYGLETTIDQQVMTKRIWDWVLSCDNQADSNSECI